MSFKSWKLKVYEWRQRYGIPAPVKGDGDPSRVRAAIKCQKEGCTATYKVRRHHKGHEFLFACIAEHLYAARYIQFHPDDTCNLCQQHHTYIHNRYDPIIVEMYIAIDFEKVRPTYELLEPWRLKLVAICDEWMKKPIRRKDAPSTIRKQVPHHSNKRSR